MLSCEHDVFQIKSNQIKSEGERGHEPRERETRWRARRERKGESEIYIDSENAREIARERARNMESAQRDRRKESGR